MKTKHRMDLAKVHPFVTPTRLCRLVGGPMDLDGKQVRLAIRKVRWEMQGHVYILYERNLLKYHSVVPPSPHQME